MVRDTLLGFPSHSLPYRYRQSYHFIDSLKEATLSGSLFSHSRDVFRGCFRLKKHIIKMRKNLIDIWGVSYYIVSVKSWRLTGKMEQKPFFREAAYIFFVNGGG